jgi:acetyl esterase
MMHLIKNNSFIILLLTIFGSHFCFSQKQIMYKQIDTTKLFLHIYQPPMMEKTQKCPTMVFFFGGGWKSGSLAQFEPHAKYFAKRGMVCFLVDYRVLNRHKSTIFQSLKDAKSAMRFIKEHANLYNVDTMKIVASGGSAGGHLAAATALIDEYNETTDNMQISCKPNVLVLFNPAIDNGPAGVGYERVKDAYKNISPIHNIQKGAPPTIIMLGTKDDLIPVETAKYYQTVMKKVGSRCDLILYEGKEHGFFNYDKFENYKKTIADADIFLQSMGYLTEKPTVAID